MLRLTLDAAKLQRLLKEQDQRVPATVQRLLQDVGTQAHAALLARSPKGDRWTRYLQDIRLGHVSGMPYSVAVYHRSTATEVKEPDPKEAVVIVRPRKGLLRPVSEEVLVLKRFNPWTLDTLPFMPDRQVATLLYRRVGERKAQKVAQARRDDKVLWRAALDKIGKRVVKKEKPPEPKIVVDVTYEVAKLEFGLGGARIEPAWGPMVRSLPSLAKQWTVRSTSRRALRDPAFRGWRAWLTPSTEPVGADQVAGFEWFQRRLATKL